MSQFDRIKGAEWFEAVRSQTVLILGAGGIGSWCAIGFSRAGFGVCIQDFDVYEEHNMTGQFVDKNGIGKNKAEAVAQLVRNFSPESTVMALVNKFDDKSGANDVMICGFDNMAARKLAFNSWKQYLTTAKDKSKCFFQDGRLNTEYYQIFNIPGDRDDLIQIYEKEHLFDSSEIEEEQQCTFKQTSHGAMAIAAEMTKYAVNWLSNVSSGEKDRQVPFYHDHALAADYQTSNNGK